LSQEPEESSSQLCLKKGIFTCYKLVVKLGQNVSCYICIASLPCASHTDNASKKVTLYIDIY